MRSLGHRGGERTGAPVRQAPTQVFAAFSSFFPVSPSLSVRCVVARFAVQMEIGQGLSPREKFAEKQEILR